MFHVYKRCCSHPTALTSPVYVLAVTAAAPAAPTRHLWSKLSVVDLAGSERQRRTANRGVRLKEAGCINNSLMSLMHCLETIRWNQKHAGAGGSARLVPFRETKLTRLFQVRMIEPDCLPFIFKYDFL